MSYVTNEVIFFIIGFGFNYLLYKKDRLIGNIGFLVLSVSSLIFSDVDRVFPFFLIGASLINLFWDILTPRKEAQSRGVYQ